MLNVTLIIYCYNLQDKRQTLMFSATFPEDVQHLAGRFLNNYLFVAVGIVGGASTDVEQIFYEVTKYEKQTTLKKLISENGEIFIKYIYIGCNER